MEKSKMYNVGLVTQMAAGKDHTGIYNKLINNAIEAKNGVDLIGSLDRLYTEKDLPITQEIQELIAKLKSGELTIKDIEGELLDFRLGLVGKIS